jgi:hypothetical protein
VLTQIVVQMREPVEILLMNLLRIQILEEIGVEPLGQIYQPYDIIGPITYSL